MMSSPKANDRYTGFRSLQRIALAFALSLATFGGAHASLVNDQMGNGLEPDRQLDQQLLNEFPGLGDLIAKRRYPEAIDLLQSGAGRYRNDSNYHYLLGVMCLQADSLACASSELELSVLISPDNAGAWLDLAITQIRLGQLDSAESYLAYIEHSFAPPAPIRELINRLRLHIDALRHPTPPKRWAVSLETGLGRDTNANNGLQDTSLALTQGSTRIVLPVDPAYRAHGDSFATAVVNFVYQPDIKTGALDVIVGVREKTYRNEHDFTNTDINLGATWKQRPNGEGLQLAIAYEHFMLGNRSLLNDYRIATQWVLGGGKCSTQAGVEIEARRFARDTHLDADLAWLQLGRACELSVAGRTARMAILARAGADHDLRERPGGFTRHYEILGQIDTQLTARLKLQVSYLQTFERDDNGYNPLLDNNAARSLQRRDSRVTLSGPLRGHLEWTAQLADSHYLSNLALFQQSGRSIYAGVRLNY